MSASQLSSTARSFGCGESRRAHLGGIIGVAAAAVTIGALPVFQHGVVISLLPATISRALCVLAFAGGAVAAATSYVTEEAR